MAVRPGDRALYVAEKVGRVVALSAGSDPRVVLDLTHRVSLGSEQGLLGLAFAPSGRYLYVDFTDTSGDTHVVGVRVRRRGRRPRERTPGAVRRAAVLEPQRRRARVRTGRAPVRGPRRRRERGRSDGERAVALDAARQAAADFPPAVEGEAVLDPARQPVRRTGGRAPGDLGLRPAEPVAALVRHGDRRPVDRRRRAERVGGDRSRARGLDQAGRISVGIGSRGPTRSRGPRRLGRSHRSTSTRTATGRAPSPVGTCTAAN